MPHMWCLRLLLPTNVVDTQSELQHHILAVNHEIFCKHETGKADIPKKESFIGGSDGRGPEDPVPHVLETARWEYLCGVALLILSVPLQGVPLCPCHVGQVGDTSSAPSQGLAMLFLS